MLMAWAQPAAAGEARAWLQKTAMSLQADAQSLHKVASERRAGCAEARKATTKPCTVQLADAIGQAEGVARAMQDLALRLADRLASAPPPVAADETACRAGDAQACGRVQAAETQLSGFADNFARPAAERLFQDRAAAIRQLAAADDRDRTNRAKTPPRATAEPLETVQPVPAPADDRQVAAAPKTPPPDALVAKKCQIGDAKACATAAETYETRREWVLAAQAWARACLKRDGPACVRAGLLAAKQPVDASPESRRKAALGWQTKACQLQDAKGCHWTAALLQAQMGDMAKMRAAALRACELGDCSDCRTLAGPMRAALTESQKASADAALAKCPPEK